MVHVADPASDRIEDSALASSSQAFDDLTTLWVVVLAGGLHDDLTTLWLVLF